MTNKTMIDSMGSAMAALGLVSVAACNGGDGDNPFDTSAPTSITVGNTMGPGTASATGTATGGGSDDDDTMGGDGPKLDIASDESGQFDTGSECAAVSDTAQVGIQPADILVVVDNSGSMQFEAQAVQNNMNAFSSQIFLANIDAHVALISSDSTDDEGICFPTPLGSGSCPDDTNLPSYLHVVDGVGSNDGLQKILDRYADWSSIFRPTASKHIILVSDDDSSLSAEAFDQAFRALDPSLEDYVFHAIASPEDPILACLAMTSCCPALIPLSADISEEYLDLTALTGGIFGNLCEQDFAPIFDQVSMAVVQGATLACEYDIPPPPDGMEFDPDEVNVEFDDGMGGVLQIGRVDGPAECAGVSDGWYYDNPAMPTSIVVCPQTCDQIQGLGNASVSIQFGCATIPAG